MYQQLDKIELKRAYDDDNHVNQQMTKHTRAEDRTEVEKGATKSGTKYGEK